MSDFRYLGERLERLAAADRHREIVPRRREGTHLVHGDGRRLMNFGGNDYLGLAASRALPTHSTGSGASALVCGWTDRHQELADRIAEFEQTESAVVFPSGFAACSGTVATLCEAGDLILSDELNHASLIDGCRLSRATCVVYPHGDADFVEHVLGEQRHRFNRVWIVTDGVFSMDGDVAPLERLVEIAARFDAFPVVDEAHGTGVVGPNGRGVCEAAGVEHEIPIRIGTLSKAIGAQGGFVCGPQVVVGYLINCCRSLVFSTSLSPASVSAGLEALATIREQPELREHVQHLSRRFRERLSIEASRIEQCIPIIPVVIGDESRTVQISQQLAELGFYVPAIRPPTVPEGTSRLRVSLSAAHDEDSVLALAAAIEKLLPSPPNAAPTPLRRVMKSAATR